MTYRYPFTPFPRGWYRLAYGHAIKRGCARRVRALGCEVTIRRRQTGELSVTARQIKLRGVGAEEAWPAREENGIVFAYFDAEGGKPLIDVPVMKEFQSDRWSRVFKFQWDIRVHVQEIAENALDLPHFSILHTYAEVPTMTAFDIDGERFRVAMKSHHNVMGIKNRITMDITYHGIGVVTAKVWTRPVEIRVILTSTPIDQEHLQVNIAVVHNKTRSCLRNAAVAMTLPHHIRTEFERDIPVWENKVYRANPLLCAGDGPIHKVRKWARQFYSPADAVAVA